MMKTVAALFVYADGPYASEQGVDLWDEARDARLYPGPHPVVAHPPCARWGSMRHLVRATRGYEPGDDGGCFAAALASVRRWGGVLEHPAYSDAWRAFDLPRPPESGGWARGICGGWSCYVEQGRYGHASRKPTWLYTFGTRPEPMAWGRTRTSRVQCGVSSQINNQIVSLANTLRLAGLDEHASNVLKAARAAYKLRDDIDLRKLGYRESSETPPAFRAALLSLARGASV